MGRDGTPELTLGSAGLRWAPGAGAAWMLSINYRGLRVRSVGVSVSLKRLPLCGPTKQSP